MSLRPGEVFAGYTVERELGAGGMGSVYLARHPRLPRFDALKLLRSELNADPGFVGRFEREADTVAQLDHPNIVPVYDRGSQDGQLWISMRFIDGTNAEKALAEYQSSSGPGTGGMPAERAVRIVGKVASALDYAHKHHLLHRDVKPANILLTSGKDDDEDSERVFLSDFGVAKAIGEAAEQISSLTSTGSVVATLDYASPEQIKGQVLTQSTDIYALGCVLYKLLTGTVPYPGESVAARVYGHLGNAVPRPSAVVPGLPPAFDDVIATAMAKEAADRYPTCRALAVAARAALTAALPAANDPATAGPSAADGLPTTLNAVVSTTDLQPVVPPPGGGPPTTRPEQPEQPVTDTGRHHHPAAGSEQRPSDPVPVPVLLDRPAASTGPPAGGMVPAQHQHLGAAPPGGPSTGPQSGLLGAPSGGPPSGLSRAVPAVGGGGPSGPPPGGSSGAPPGARSGVTPVVSPPNRGPSRAPSRRAMVIGGSAAAVVVIAAVAAAVIFGGNVAGTGTTVAGSTIGSPVVTTSGAPSSPSSVSSSAVASTPVPVPGLPHSTPLPDDVLIGSRSVDGASNLYQFDAATGQLGKQLTTGSPGTQFAILSPDRGSVIYLQTSPTGSTLRTMAVDGTQDRQLSAQLPADCAAMNRPAWNPAAQTTLALPCVTAAKTTVLHRVSIDGADLGVIDTGFPVVDDVTYSPDGTTLAFWGSESPGQENTIFTMPSDASAPAKQVVERAPNSTDADPAFSPDGSKIAFRRLVHNPDGSASAQIVVVDADGSNPVPLTDGKSVDQDPIWSPTGERIAFKSNRLNAAGTNDNQIWVINTDGTGLEELGKGSPGVGDGAPAWGHR